MSASTPHFDTAGLHAALDSRRRALRLTWAQLASETHVATSTLARAAHGGDMEVDGAMWLLQWLGASYEAFLRTPGTMAAPALRNPEPRDDALPPGAPRWTAYRRFDTTALHAALDAERAKRGLTWRQVAGEIRSPLVTTGTLTGFAKGGRTGLSRLVPVLSWLGKPAEAFLTLPATARGRAGGDRRL